MNRKNFVVVGIIAALVAFFIPQGTALAAQTGAIVLPKPETDGGKPLMQALSLRKAERSFSDRELPLQELANLLWATWGVNRPDGRRTAPTARNKQEVAVYLVLKSGVWLYDGLKNTLEPALEGDFREKFGGWPVTLVFAAPEADRAAGMHLGSLYQNAGLYCASAGLSNVVKTTGADALNGLLSLPTGYKVFVVQSLGYPQ